MEYVPEDNVDSSYYSKEMDFNNTHQDEWMGDDTLLEWDCYCQQNKSS